MLGKIKKSMHYTAILDFIINLFQITISILPKKKKDTLRKVLHGKFCVNSFGSLFYDKKLIESIHDNTPSGAAIGDHLCTIFSDAVIHKPSLIVELGTRGGESTKLLLAAAYYSKANVLSIDLGEQPKLEPCIYPLRCMLIQIGRVNEVTPIVSGR